MRVCGCRRSSCARARACACARACRNPHASPRSRAGRGSRGSRGGRGGRGRRGRALGPFLPRLGVRDEQLARGPAERAHVGRVALRSPERAVTAGRVRRQHGQQRVELRVAARRSASIASSSRGVRRSAALDSSCAAARRNATRSFAASARAPAATRSRSASGSARGAPAGAAREGAPAAGAAARRRPRPAALGEGRGGQLDTFCQRRHDLVVVLGRESGSSASGSIVAGWASVAGAIKKNRYSLRAKFKASSNWTTTRFFLYLAPHLDFALLWSAPIVHWLVILTIGESRRK